MKIRSVLESACVVFHSMLTKGDREDIERIQKMAFRIILKDNYINYKTALNTLSAQTLEQRRTKLCQKFANKNLKSDKSFFIKVVKNMNTRGKSDNVKEFKCNFGRFRKSSLPYLARLLNE